MSHTIALVDDDRNILTSVSIALEAEGFRVRAYGDGEEALRCLTAQPVDLAILDIKMPRMDGVELLKRLRRTSRLPVIFLTSKDEEIDEVLGFKMGADDYIRKPFSLRLLIERIQAVLRRADLAADGGIDDSQAHIIRGDLALDPARHECSWRGTGITLTVTEFLIRGHDQAGHRRPGITLTVTEFLILKSLVSRPGHVRSRDQLMDAAYDDDIYVDDRTIDSHIKRIRKKFKSVDPTFHQIETLYGVGYRYTEK